MNTATRILSLRGLNRLVILLGTLLVPAIHLRALIITTNCPEVAASLPHPKRIQSGCPSIGPLSYFSVFPQFSSGGIYHIFANNPGGFPNAFGLGWSDTQGVFNWKVACSNGFIAPLNAQARILSFQDLPAGISNVTCFGVYDRSAGTFAPLFEKRLPINNRAFVGQTLLNNGTFILSLNRSNSISLLGVSSSGTLLWASQLTSAEFPIVSSGPNDPGRAVAVSEIGTNNILLSLTANANVGTTNAVTVLIRLDSSGVIQWSKKFQIPLVGSAPSSSGSQIFVTSGGEVLLTAYDYGLQGTTAVQFTHLTKVASDGTLAWSRKIVGGLMGSGPRQVGSQGALLLDLISSGAAGSHSVCGILSAGGQVTSLVQIDPPATGLVRPQAVSIPQGKIYFAGNSGTMPVIGSSSLTLTNFTAKQYVKGPLINQSLTLLEDGHLAFVGAEANLTNSHLLLLNSTLAEEAGCSFFAPLTLNTSSPVITVATNSLTLSAISVTTSNLTLSLVSTQLQFQVIAFQEQALCTTNCEYWLSSGGIASGSAGGSTNVNVIVTSLSNCSWGVANPCADWITVSPMNATGSGQLNFGVGYNSGNPRTCTLTIAGQPFTVTQAGDVRVLAEALDATKLLWTTGGNADWSTQSIVTHDGVDAGQSGTISDDQESWLETSVTGPGTLTFWWKVSSQAASDRLRFNINGLQQNTITGEVDWRQMTYSIASGSNVLRWRYTKDFGGSSGQDRGWVDQVVWTPTAACSFSLSTSTMALGPSGGNANVNVTVAIGTNCSWNSFNPCVDWLTVSPTNGTGNEQVTITASANNTGAPRNCTLTLAGSTVAIVQAAVSSGDLLVQYNPTGSHTSGAPVPPSLVAQNVTASSLQEVGLETTWNNTDTLPVGRIATSATADPSQYLTLTLASVAGQPITFKGLSYDKQSYLGAGPAHASVRSSLDSFGTNIAVVNVNPDGFQSLNFDLSAVPVAPASVTFRIYFYGAPAFTDWADLVSSARGGNGLRVNGTVNAGSPITILVGDAAFGFAGGKFGFNVNGPTGRDVVIESSLDLQHWTPVQTNPIGAGPVYFSDPQSAHSGARYYRARLE